MHCSALLLQLGAALSGQRDRRCPAQVPEGAGGAAAQGGPRELFDFRGQRTGVSYGSSGSAAASAYFLTWTQLRQVLRTCRDEPNSTWLPQKCLRLSLAPGKRQRPLPDALELCRLEQATG